MATAIICGSCVVDLPCVSVELSQPIGTEATHAIDPIAPTAGGITCNTGIGLQRLGVQTGLLTLVGDDSWGTLIRKLLDDEGVHHRHVQTHPTDPTTAVVVLVDGNGQRSFLVPGVKTATKSIDQTFIRGHMEWIGKATYFVCGYFGRMPLLEPDLADLLRDIRATGCQTVMDSAADGGDPVRLRNLLPHLDIYIPSEAEAREQTREADPKSMVSWFRRHGAPGIVGVKLGEAGALLHHPDTGFIKLPAMPPPGPIVDTIGAGDAFMAGLMAGLERKLPLAEAGRWATAAGALAVTAGGGHAGLQNESQLRSLLQD